MQRYGNVIPGTGPRCRAKRGLATSPRRNELPLNRTVSSPTAGRLQIIEWLHKLSDLPIVVAAALGDGRTGGVCGSAASVGARRGRAEGVRTVLSGLTAELALVMKQLGVSRLDQLTEDLLTDPTECHRSGL